MSVASIPSSCSRAFEFARRVGAEEVVVLGHVAADHGGDLRVVGLAVALREPVERHDRLDLVGPQRGEDEAEHAAHAEPDDTDRVAGRRLVVGEEVDGTAHVATGTIGRHRLHQLAGLVHLGVLGEVAVVQVGAQRDEPLGGEPVGHLLDAGVEAPPLLHDDQAGSGAALREGEVPRCTGCRCSENRRSVLRNLPWPRTVDDGLGCAIPWRHDLRRSSARTRRSRPHRPTPTSTIGRTCSIRGRRRRRSTRR